MRIGILGTRGGIPNHYGGFEQFAEFLSIYLKEQGHQVWVYNSSSHPYQEKEYHGVNLIHCKDPEEKIGTIGQFIYDYHCIRDSVKRDFDVLLQLGYTSSSVWSFLLPKKAVVVSNMDGLEWKRTKYSASVQSFLKWAEARAVKSSDHLVADSVGIQNYLKKSYKKESSYIAYGAKSIESPSTEFLNEFGLEINGYDMLVARLEPENSIEMILEGRDLAAIERPFLVVGKTNNAFSQKMLEKFKHNPMIRFTGGIYDQDKLNALRFYSNIYFHGHTVGGTNPSLLEAMGCSCLIAAHKNEFNSAILKDKAFYFRDSAEVIGILESVRKEDRPEWISENKTRIEKEFNWNRINAMYEDLFKSLI